VRGREGVGHEEGRYFPFLAKRRKGEGTRVEDNNKAVHKILEYACGEKDFITGETTIICDGAKKGV